AVSSFEGGGSECTDGGSSAPDVSTVPAAAVPSAAAVLSGDVTASSTASGASSVSSASTAAARVASTTSTSAPARLITIRGRPSSTSERTPTIIPGSSYTGIGVGPYSLSAVSFRVTTVNLPSRDGQYGALAGDDLMNAPVNDCPRIDPSLIPSRTSSANGVLEYRVTVSRPRSSSRISNGTPSGTDPRSLGVPCNV